MLQHDHDPLNRQRRRRVRQRVLRRVACRLRHDLTRTQRLLAALAAVATLSLGVALALALWPAPAPEPVLLGRGTAGVFPASDRAGTPGPDSTARARPGRPRAGVVPRARDSALGSGEASYYGDELRGEPTASGEAFNPQGLTAAHRTLPLGSRVRVTNLSNGRSVVVRVNDRGPFAPHRVIDVSHAAARALGMLQRGTERVRLELLLS